MTRSRPIVVSTRVNRTERRAIQEAAESLGMTISEMLHHLLMPKVSEVLRQLLNELADESGD